jgi:hypothetical protein
MRLRSSQRRSRAANLVTVGTVEDQDAHQWFALIDPQEFLHVSELDDLDRSLYSARSRRTL